MFSIGALALLTGRLDGTSYILGLPIGPAGQNLWFDREAWKDTLSLEQRMATQMAGGPQFVHGLFRRRQSHAENQPALVGGPHVHENRIG